jgi:hypothetical protein
MATTYDFVTYNQELNGGKMGDGTVKGQSQGTRSQIGAFNT